MTELEIAERLILAAETERKLPRTGERPRGDGRGYTLHWVHSAADMLAWKHDPHDPKDQYQKDDCQEYGAQHTREFFDGRFLRPSSADMSAWEECLRWTAELLDDARHRRALWAWAFSKVGGRSFTKWCKAEGIHRNTGMARKNEACTRISAQLVRSAVQNSDNGQIRTLQEPHQISDVAGRIGNAWRPEAYWLSSTSNASEFEWSEARNKANRQRYAKRKAEAA